jgi:hypothetical protein
VVASDIFGASGRAMMAAMIAGERDPRVLAQLARRRMRAKIGRLEQAFDGHFEDHHRFLLARMLSRIDGIDADIAAVDAQIEAQLAPFAQAAARLDDIPGIGPVAAAAIIAELGVGMSRGSRPPGICARGRSSRRVSSPRQARPRATPRPDMGTRTWRAFSARLPPAPAGATPSSVPATGASPDGAVNHAPSSRSDAPCW